ncbi:MAG: FKBP-type peptidyl-prolyl cis-trans isomerase [Bacteroidota bacterium]
MNLNQLSFIVVVFAAIFSSCGGGNSYTPLPFSEGSQEAIDNELIIKHLVAQGIEAQHTESGIYYVIETPGEGEHPTEQSTLTAHYTGTTLDGKKFDSSLDKGQPMSFKLGGMIQGWKECIPILKKGGKGTFYIPSGLAYGQRGYPGLIPPNAPLKFEVELIDFKDQEAEDEKLITAYLAANELEYERTPDGIYYKMEVEGEGEHPTASSTVKCHYTGTFLDGTKFDSSYDYPGEQPIEFSLQRVIPGWTKGIPLLKPGGKATLIIPSGIAYGSFGNPRGNPPIPPNTVLKFEVELVEIK